MRLVLGDVEVADAEREVDGVEVLERLRQEREMRREEDQDQRDAGRSLDVVTRQTGRSLSASFRLPRR